MIIYVLSVLLGAASLIAALSCAEEDMFKRKRRCQNMLHTDFVLYDMKHPENAPASSLHRTYNVIGRRRRKCDLCLDFTGDQSISRIHAVLTYRKGVFYVAPYQHNLPWSRKPLPEVYVDGALVPPEGVRVGYGMVVRIGNTEFYLKDTREARK